jgi:hypothetical protein
MAEGSAMFPDQATVWIGAAGASTAACVAVTAEVTNFTESGGEEDKESVAVFGGGFIDKTKPRTQIEVSFDVVIRYSSTPSTVLKWDQMKWGAIAGSTVTASSNPTANVIFVQFTDGTNFYTRAYNNAYAVTFEPETAADDMAKGTISFKLSPNTPTAVSNIKITNLHASTITSWT